MEQESTCLLRITNLYIFVVMGAIRYLNLIDAKCERSDNLVDLDFQLYMYQDLSLVGPS